MKVEPLGRRDAVLLAGIALAAVGVMAPLLREPFASQAIVGTDSYRSHDWLEVAKFDHFARRALVEHHTLPFWNPLIGGGLPQFAHPSDGSMGPLILPTLLTSAVLGPKIVVVLVAALGAMGLYLLGRGRARLSRPASTFAALAYVGAGWLPSRVAVGFYESCLMMAVPAVLAAWTWPFARRGPALAAGTVLLWALSIQLQLALPVIVLLMALWLVVEVALGPRLDPPPSVLLRDGAGLLITAALLGAPKFLPMLDLLDAAGFREAKLYPTHTDAWYVDLRQAFYGLFHVVPAVPLVDRDGNPRVQEYISIAPGLGTLLLLPIGVLTALRRGEALRPVLVLAFAFAWLSFGPHAPWDAFTVLHPLPLFASMRGPLRYFTWPVLLGIVLIAGRAIDALSTRRSGTQRPVLASALLVVAALLNTGMIGHGQTLHRTAFLYGVPPSPSTERPRSEGLFGFSLGGAQTLNLRKYLNTVRGVPTVFTAEDLPLPAAPTPQAWLYADGRRVADPGYLGEAWPADADGKAIVDAPDHAMADVISFGPNGVLVESTLVAPGIVVVNQNHRPGWTCGDRPARAVERDRGPLLAFDAPAGAARTLCRYHPPLFAPGLGLALVGALLLLWLARTGTGLPVGQARLVRSSQGAPLSRGSTPGRTVAGPGPGEEGV